MTRILLLAALVLSTAACRSTPGGGVPEGATAHYVALRDPSVVLCAAPLVRHGERVELPHMWLELAEGVRLESLRLTRIGPGVEPETVFTATNRTESSGGLIHGLNLRLARDESVELSVKHSAAATPLRATLR